MIHTHHAEPSDVEIFSPSMTIMKEVCGNLSQAQGEKVHFIMDMWSGVDHGYLSLTIHWWQPKDMKSGRASDTGMQGEALVLLPGYRSILLQVQHMES